MPQVLLLHTSSFFCVLMLFIGCIPAQDPPSDTQETIRKQYILNFPLPPSLEFAGESVPIDDPEIAERLDRELMALSYYHASTLLVLKRSKRWKAFLQQQLQEAQIPEDFFFLAVAESSLSNTARSSAQAVGMWQLMKETSRELGLEVSTYVDQRRDPFLATKSAIRYIQRAYKQLENWTLVAASYNRGTRGILNALEAQGVHTYYDLYLHEETYRYLFKILAYKVILSEPEAYGFHVPESPMYEPWETRSVEISTPISSLPDWGRQHGVTYREIKKYNPWITSIDYSLPVKAGKVYTIRLPK